mmetsp:Transcript_24650/g.49250  ORF Transcript_24650/g.49250 Transcript_24650/m.49250 type:complete len:262 (+) Transcript_24650:193-978(+)
MHLGICRGRFMAGTWLRLPGSGVANNASRNNCVLVLPHHCCLPNYRKVYWRPSDDSSMGRCCHGCGRGCCSGVERGRGAGSRGPASADATHHVRLQLFPDGAGCPRVPGPSPPEHHHTGRCLRAARRRLVVLGRRRHPRPLTAARPRARAGIRLRPPLGQLGLHRFDPGTAGSVVGKAPELRGRGRVLVGAAVGGWICERAHRRRDWRQHHIRGLTDHCGVHGAGGGHRPRAQASQGRETKGRQNAGHVDAAAVRVRVLIR